MPTREWRTRAARESSVSACSVSYSLDPAVHADASTALAPSRLTLLCCAGRPGLTIHAGLVHFSVALATRPPIEPMVVTPSGFVDAATGRCRMQSPTSHSAPNFHLARTQYSPTRLNFFCFEAFHTSATSLLTSTWSLSQVYVAHPNPVSLSLARTPAGPSLRASFLSATCPRIYGSCFDPMVRCAGCVGVPSRCHRQCRATLGPRAPERCLCRDQWRRGHSVWCFPDADRLTIEQRRGKCVLLMCDDDDQLGIEFVLAMPFRGDDRC